MNNGRRDFTLEGDFLKNNPTLTKLADSAEDSTYYRVVLKENMLLTALMSRPQLKQIFRKIGLLYNKDMSFEDLREGLQSYLERKEPYDKEVMKLVEHKLKHTRATTEEKRQGPREMAHVEILLREIHKLLQSINSTLEEAKHLAAAVEAGEFPDVEQAASVRSQIVVLEAKISGMQIGLNACFVAWDSMAEEDKVAK